jgi:hypothetical protein
MKRTIELRKNGGVWQYRIYDTFEGKKFPRVSWEFGLIDADATIDQAMGRFGHCDEILYV